MGQGSKPVSGAKGQHPICPVVKNAYQKIGFLNDATICKLLKHATVKTTLKSKEPGFEELGRVFVRLKPSHKSTGDASTVEVWVGKF